MKNKRRRFFILILKEEKINFTFDLFFIGFAFAENQKMIAKSNNFPKKNFDFS